jgi:A/G-specific adenine glycosylase
VTAVLAWFDAHERPLPWRSSTPWGVFVSEFMLQQTPVDRVLPVWALWLGRWPAPADLAASPLSEALRAWGRLGYPRRAKRLHEAARIIVEQHGGAVPDDENDLRALPGVGQYTAAAVRSFAFGRRAVVMDTNVRRVLARAVEGRSNAPAHIAADERSRADALWPVEDARGARWSAAVMEFGALVCTARRPACGECVVVDQCAWTAAGQPVDPGLVRRQPRYDGSDRQARGHVLSVLRERRGAATRSAVLDGWPDPDQAHRALDSLVADGLVTEPRAGRYALAG